MDSDVFNADTIPAVLVTLPMAVVGIAVGIRVSPLISDHQLRRISVMLLVATSLLAIATATTALL